MIWGSQVAREIDQRSITNYGIPSIDLMEEAGLAVARFAMEIWQPGCQVLIAAGSGNNGGDAFVAARHLAEAGFAPQVFDIRSEHNQETPDRQTQRLRYESLGFTCLAFHTAQDFAPFHEATLIIDGLLGLGPTQPLRSGNIQQCLQALAQINARLVLAIDLPSGMLADVWQPADAILKATHTISFGAPKLIHRLEPARSQCGRIRIVPLRFHERAIDETLLGVPYVLHDDRELLPTASPWENLPTFAHKYIRGHVLVIGGSAGKLGAPLLSAQACLRSGVGWVSVALLSQDHQPSLPQSLTYENFAVDGHIPSETLLNFIDERKVKALIIGPGTMKNPLQKDLLQALQVRQKNHGLFLVFDAGALKDWGSLARGIVFDPLQTLLTPHPGEWRAIQTSHSDLTSLDSLAEAWQFCESFGVSVFYKTATPFTLSACPGNQLLVNGDGTQALAKAGTGDVLAGIVAALGCAGIPANFAGNQAQRTLARAAAIAIEEFGQDGIGPEDLIRKLGHSKEQ